MEDTWGEKLLDWWRDNPTQPITDPGRLASLKRAFQAQKKLLEYRQACLRRWNIADQSCFTQVFGTALDSARQTILGRVEHQLTHVDKMLTDEACTRRVFDAVPPDPNEYAHVWADDERHNIYLNKHFWPSGLTGQDSKAGALSHEMSHFEDLGATKDVKYGEKTMYGVSNAQFLAHHAPADALKNADNYEYYLEGAICP